MPSPPGRYSDSGRLLSVTVAGGPVARSVVDRVYAASISLSTTQVAQLSMSIVDPQLQLAQAGYLAKGTIITYGSLLFEVAVRSVGPVQGNAGLQVDARARGAQVLKRLVGSRVWRSISPTDWLRGECAWATKDGGGPLTLIAQPTAPMSQIVRQTPQPGQVTPPSSWDVAQALASQLGFLFFETAGRVYFGQPSWLVAHLPRQSVGWSQHAPDPRLWDVPTVRDSDNSTDKTVTGSLTCSPDLADLLYPGAALALTMPPYSGVYYVTDLSLNLDGVTPATVSFSTPQNPTPQPADAP